MKSIQIFNQDTSKDQSAWKIFQLTEIPCKVSYKLFESFVWK